MSRTKTNLVSAVSILIGMAVSGQAMASNGYFAIGYGTKSKGMGGAGIAFPQDSLASATNPAGMVFVGDRVDVGLNTLKTKATETYLVGSTVVFEEELDNQYQVFPHFGYNGMLDPFSSIGVSLYANDGILSETPTRQLTLDQGFANFSYARRIGEKSSLGGSILVAAQGFSTNYDGSSAPADSSFGYGLKLGWQGYLGGGVSLGATWQPKIRMTDLEKYSVWLADNGGLDIPSTYGAGLAWVFHGLALAADYQRINYGEVDVLGTSGFGWTSVNVYKLGIQYAFEHFALRAGFSHGDNPVPMAAIDLNGAVPVMIQNHATAGFTAKLGESSELNVALIYGLDKTAEGASIAFPGVTIESNQSQYAAEISFGVKF